MTGQQNMQHIRHFIWDFDGTLYDTYPVITNNLRMALGEFGYDCDYPEAMRLMLETIPAARNHYADKFGIERTELAAAYNRHHKASHVALLARPFNGVKEVLKQIVTSGRCNYVYTHRRDDECLEYLKKYGLDLYFKEIIGSDSPNFSAKPSPEAVNYLLEKYGIVANEAVMIGDRECDLGSGRNAGINTLHFLCAVAPEELDCTWRISDFHEMLDLL